MQTAANSPSEARALEEIRGWIQGTMGIMFHDDKLDVLQRRLADVMHRGAVDSYATLYSRLISTEFRELQLLMSQALTVNHTAFFRENGSLEKLFEAELPNAPGEPVRVWSAACSTGEEPYSLSMLAHERFGAASARQLAILATDINGRATKAATEALYRPESLTPVSRLRRERFFDETPDGRFRLKQEVTSLVTIRRLNLATGRWPFKRQFHAVYCRNVLYYFDPDLRARIAGRMYEHAVPGGYLFTSVTESLRGLDTQWHHVGPGIYRKDGD